MNHSNDHTVPASWTHQQTNPSTEVCPYPGSEQNEAAHTVPNSGGGADRQECSLSERHLDSESRLHFPSSRNLQPMTPKRSRVMHTKGTEMPIPKSITFRTPTRVRRQRDVSNPTEGNLMPLSDLALLISSQLSDAVERGLYPSNECKESESQQKE